MVATRALPQNDRLEDTETELRRCLRDIVALSGLPGIWINANAEQVATSLAQLVVSILDADIACVSLPDHALDVVQCHNRTTATQILLNDLKPEWRKANVKFEFDHPREGRLYGSSVAIGKEPGSILVALCRRLGFPTETEQLLLRVAASQAAVTIQRWQTEQTLRSEILRRKEIDSHLRLLLDSAADAFYSVDCEGTTTLCNAACLRMLGFNHVDEVIGTKIDDIIHRTRPDGSPYPDTECPMYLATRTGEHAHRDNEIFFRRDGSSFPVEYWVRPIERDGELQGAICTFLDISERRAAEKAVAEQARTLEILNSTGKTIAAELDLKTIVQLVTDAGVELTGAEFGAFFYNVINQTGEQYMLYALSGVDHSAFEKFPMPRNTAVFAPTFSGEAIVRSDDITKDPRYGKNKPNSGMPEGHLPVRSYLAVPVKSRGGNVLGGLFFGHSKPGVFTEHIERTIVGIAAQAAIAMDNARLFEAAQREIEDRKRTEQELRLRGEEFSALADNIPTLCWMAYPDGHIFWYNRRWYEYTGMPPETQEGWGWESVHDPKALPAVLERWRHSIATGEHFEMVFPLKGADGKFRPFLTRVVPIRDDNGQILRWFGTNVDISEQRATEEELERRVAAAVAERDQVEAAFRQSQKMEAIGQLTGGVAHDFNNLLTVIRSSIDLLRKPGLPDEKRRRYMDAISETTDRAANLTSQLLAFSRRQPLKAVVFDVVEIVRRTVEFLRPVVGARIEIRTEFACASYFIHADLNQFETALINVAANARDAMNGEGEILIAVSPRSQPGSESELNVIEIALVDQGKGIDPSHLDHIFEPFFTTKEVGKGTGLGLSQVYGFVKQSGGDIQVESSRWKGDQGDAPFADGRSRPAPGAEHRSPIDS